MTTGIPGTPRELIPLDAQDDAPAGPSGISATHRALAVARLELIQAWDNYRAVSVGNSSAIDDEFIVGYHNGMIAEALYPIIGRVSRPTLYRWRNLLDGTKDWQLLLPRYNRDKKALNRLSPEEKFFFHSQLLNDNKIKIGNAISTTKRLLAENGIPTTKADITFRRYAEEFKTHYYDQWIFAREGLKALRDKVEPYITRDPSVLDVGDVLVADGHRLDFLVINPYTGKPCRATLIGYVDWRSYDLAGYEIMVEENTQCIAAAMRNAIIHLGKFPRVSYQDNGRAFRARFFTGTTDFTGTGLSGLFARLGIAPVFAHPYNARAKIIELWWKGFSDTFERYMPSFIGTSIKDKPAYMLPNEKFHRAMRNVYVPTISEAVELIEMWLKFHREKPCPYERKPRPGCSTRRCIGEVSEAGRGKGVDLAELDDLMMDDKLGRIERSRIRFLSQDYEAEELYGLKMPRVVIKYSLFDLSFIKVFKTDGTPICRAERVVAVNPMASQFGTPKDVADLKHRILSTKRLEKTTTRSVAALARMGEKPQLDWQDAARLQESAVKKIESAGAEYVGRVEQIPDGAFTPAALPPIDATVGDKAEGLFIDPPTSATEGVTRLEPAKPHFNTSTDRYEWHCKYGRFTKEDVAWCTWFQTTDEFVMLFTFFDEQRAEQVKTDAK